MSTADDLWLEIRGAHDEFLDLQNEVDTILNQLKPRASVPDTDYFDPLSTHSIYLAAKRQREIALTIETDAKNYYLGKKDIYERLGDISSDEFEGAKSGMHFEDMRRATSRMYYAGSLALNGLAKIRLGYYERIRKQCSLNAMYKVFGNGWTDLEQRANIAKNSWPTCRPSRDLPAPASGYGDEFYDTCDFIERLYEQSKALRVEWDQLATALEQKYSQLKEISKEDNLSRWVERAIAFATGLATGLIVWWISSLASRG